MRRAAAIIGPTASFVRWSIDFECRFRQPADQEPTYQTFRQLRSLREVSVAELENRIVDGVCIHPEFNQDAESARGFPIDEIELIYGDLEKAKQLCGTCPANALKAATGNHLAGCYGWFFSKDENDDLIQEFQVARDRNPSDFESFPRTNRSWFGVWKNTRWSGTRLADLRTAMNNLPAKILLDHADFGSFINAVESCLDHSLTLETELVPAGYSDGVHWQIEPHCSVCRYEMKVDDKLCHECGEKSPPAPGKRRKVLGLRPYMLLRAIFGVEHTARILERFECR